MGDIRNLVIISDTHCGCSFGLCPDRVMLDGGDEHINTPYQKEVYDKFNEFFDEWVPEVTKGEDYALIINGDVIDGNHHNSTSQITHNLKDQRNIAIQVLEPIVGRKRCKKLYMTRGTEVHVGQSGCDEEDVAKYLGAIPNDIGQHARWELKLVVGKQEQIVNVTHHIGFSSSQAYETTALTKEYMEACTEAGRWNEKPPSILVRSHRHRSIKVEIPSEHGLGIVIVTPSWQLKTPYTYRLPLGRVGLPQIGGIIVRDGGSDGLYTRSKVWRIQTTKTEKV
jgi:hypothetical protein